MKKILISSSVLLLSLSFGGCTNSTPNTNEPANGDKIEFTAVQNVIEQRCLKCHGTTGVASIKFDSPEHIKENAAKINEKAVVQKSMPPGNQTNITDAERELLGKWIAQGANI